MATTNDITGDSLTSKVNNDAFRNNFEKIFGKKPHKVETRVQGANDSGELSSEGDRKGSGLRSDGGTSGTDIGGDE